jgi:predicted transposase/invertase (TIGR01784 family)
VPGIKGEYQVLSVTILPLLVLYRLQDPVLYWNWKETALAKETRLNEYEDIIDICMDNVFKAVFTKDSPASKAALSGLVSAVVGRELSIITIVANEPPPENLRDRQIRFDINCRADNGELVNVEMSLNPDTFEPVRLEFHAAKLFTGQDIRGIKKTYDDLKRAYQIAILVKEKFFPDGDFFHSFEYYDPERRVSLEGRTHILTLELSKLEGVARKPTGEMSSPERWAVFFKYLRDTDMREKINEILKAEEEIAMASEVLLEISRDEVERARLNSEYKYQLDMQSKLVHAKREGRQEGEQKGRQEGEQKGRQEIISLLRSGKSPEEILRDYGTH